MARQRYCPVCEGDHFKKVVITLPSGRARETEFNYCCRCLLVFFQDRPRAAPAARPVSSRSKALGPDPKDDELPH